MATHLVISVGHQVVDAVAGGGGGQEGAVLDVGAGHLLVVHPVTLHHGGGVRGAGWLPGDVDGGSRGRTHLRQEVTCRLLGGEFGGHVAPRGARHHNCLVTSGRRMELEVTSHGTLG